MGMHIYFNYPHTFTDPPIDLVHPMVNQLEDYSWSSFSAYINKATATDWLCREKIYQMPGKRKKYQGYQVHVSQGVDQEIQQYYNKGNIFSVLRDKDFRESVKQETQDVDLKILRTEFQDRPVGRRTSNSASAFAMYA